MTCNSIATANGLVDLSLPDQIAKYLDSDSARIVMLAHLQEKTGSATWYPERDRVVIGTDLIDFYYANGKVFARAKNYSVSQAEIDQAVADLSDILSQAAGMLFQQAVSQAVAELGWIESQEIAGNGAMVLTVDL